MKAFFAYNSTYSSRYFTVTCDNNTINPHKLLPIVLPHLQGEGGGKRHLKWSLVLNSNCMVLVKAPNSRQLPESRALTMRLFRVGWRNEVQFVVVVFNFS